MPRSPVTNPPLIYNVSWEEPNVYHGGESCEHTSLPLQRARFTLRTRGRYAERCDLGYGATASTRCRTVGTQLQIPLYLAVHNRKYVIKNYAGVLKRAGGSNYMTELNKNTKNLDKTAAQKSYLKVIKLFYFFNVKKKETWRREQKNVRKYYEALTDAYIDKITSIISTVAWTA